MSEENKSVFKGIKVWLKWPRKKVVLELKIGMKIENKSIRKHVVSPSQNVSKPIFKGCKMVLTYYCIYKSTNRNDDSSENIRILLIPIRI